MSFYTSIAAQYHHIFPVNQMQVQFIEQCIGERNMENGILEIGCGIGGLVKALDEKYIPVFAFDLDAEMVQRAQRQSYIHKPAIKLGNMLNLEKLYPEQHFDCILCFGNTLVHLANEQEIKDFLQQAYHRLSSGGKLLIQIINYDRILDQAIDHLATIENDSIQFVRKYNYNSVKGLIQFKTDLTIKKTGQLIQNEQSLYPIRAARLKEMMQEIGFNVIGFYGNFKGDPLTKDSVPLIVEVVKV